MQTNQRSQLWIAACIYIGQILVGFGLGWSAPVIPMLQDPEQTPLSYGISETEASLIGSLLYVGTFGTYFWTAFGWIVCLWMVLCQQAKRSKTSFILIGPYVSGYLSNLIGRKPCLLISGCISCVAYIILALANNLAMVYAARILIGIGISVIIVTNLVYIGEIASTNLRGILLTGTGIFSTFGTLLVYSTAPYLPYSVTGYVGIVLSTVYCIGLLFIPETPLYFVMKGNEKAAKKALYNLGRHEDMDNVMSIKNTDKKISGKEEWTQIFTVKSNRKALTITLTLNILQQLSGMTVVIFFGTTIFRLAGSSIDPNIATIIIGATQVTASCITPIFVERAGRKMLMLLSTAFCCVSLTVLGVYFYMSEIDHPLAAKLKWVPLVTLMIFFISYDLGFAIIPNTFIGEMFHSNVRSTGSAVTITLGWVVGFSVTSVFGYFITALGGHVTFWIFAGSCAVAFLFTLLYVPETKGKTLGEIQEMLSK